MAVDKEKDDIVFEESLSGDTVSDTGGDIISDEEALEDMLPDNNAVSDKDVSSGDDIISDEETAEEITSSDDIVDIHPDTEGVEGDLTPKEQMRADLRTARTYINIAEHMRQLEDQDKYYTRANKYLRKVRDYYRDVAKDEKTARKFTLKLQRLVRKKFRIRSEGKIAMYEEACRVRDNAKTVSDYYNAQTIFERIHQYELKRVINKNWVDPDLYAKTEQCADSEQQAKFCAEKAAEIARRTRAHSLVACVVFIGCIIALLMFSRTLQFRNVVGHLQDLGGDYEGSWHSYKHVVDNGDASLQDTYIAERYKSGLHAEKTGDYATALSNFRAAADENYKDSEDRLLKLELDSLRNPEKYDSGLGKVISFGNVKWRILEAEGDRVFLLKEVSLRKDQITKEAIPFNDHEDEHLTWETSSLRRWLNDAEGTESGTPGFLGAQFTPKERELILESDVPGAGNKEYGVAPGNQTKDKIFLLTAEQVEYYTSMKPRRIAKGTSFWWLMTPGKYPGTMAFVSPTRRIKYFGYDGASSFCAIRPCMWVDISQ